MSLYSFDQTIIVGKVGRDAELRFTPSGVQVTSFSVAVDRSYKDKASGEQVKRTIWYRVSVWGNFAQVCADIHKGDTVMVIGQMEPDWDTGAPRLWDKQDGKSAASYELKAHEVKILSRKVTATETAEALGGVEVGEELPF